MRRILFFSIIFFTNISQIFAFDASISVDKSSLNINDIIHLKLEIRDIKNTEKLEIKDIAGMDDFEIISTNQSQSFSSKSVIINGDVKREVKSLFFVDFAIKAKKSGDLKIGPVSLSSGEETKKTNSIDLKVEGKKIGKFATIKKEEIKPEKKEEKKEIKDIPKSEKIEDFLSFENSLKIIIVFIIIFIILILIIFSRNNKTSEKEEEIKEEEKEEDFEIENVDIPSLDDEDFMEKIGKYLKLKLKEKYNLGFRELKNLKNLEKNKLLSREDLENLIKFNEKVDIIKYSNLLSSKNELIEIVEKF